MNSTAAPRFVWLQRQRTVPGRALGLSSAAKIVRHAWPEILTAQKSGSVLGDMDEITVVFVSDRRIAALHGQFLGDASSTDVITFQHGELVVSVETARREAEERGEKVFREIARYVVHGLLHLAGWSDAHVRQASAMHAVQEKILASAGRDL